MTERCQAKFTEKFDNFNYIIYLGIFCTSVAVLLFYRQVIHACIFVRSLFYGNEVTHFCFGCRFHFTTIAFSYGLGCLACYYGVNSSILLDYVEKLECHFLGSCAEKKLDDAPKKVGTYLPKWSNTCLFLHPPKLLAKVYE